MTEFNHIEICKTCGWAGRDKEGVLIRCDNLLFHGALKLHILTPRCFRHIALNPNNSAEIRALMALAIDIIRLGNELQGRVANIFDNFNSMTDFFSGRLRKEKDDGK